jgi:hypothetical protein
VIDKKKMEAIYEEQFTVFMDFLGFAEASFQTEDTSRQKVLNLLLSLTSLRGEFNIRSTVEETSASYEIKPAISTFSDHIVISYPLQSVQSGMKFEESSAIAVIIMHFRQLLTHIASAALRIGFLVRGGATIGKLYHSQGVVFGEALVEAYNLESSTAVYPRVVLAGKILDRWQWPNRPSIIQDADGLFHVDYFSLFLFTSPYPTQRYTADVRKRLDEVIPVIIRNLTELRAKGELTKFAKWAWFARQFRAGLEKAHPEHLKALGISLDMIPVP